MVPQHGKIICQFLTKLSISLQRDPARALLSIYPSELKAHSHTNICTWKFIATLFITIQTWKQPTCPSVDKQGINKL